MYTYIVVDSNADLIGYVTKTDKDLYYVDGKIELKKGDKSHIFDIVNCVRKRNTYTLKNSNITLKMVNVLTLNNKRRKHIG